MSADEYEWDEPAPATEPASYTAEEPELQPLACSNLLAWVEGLLSPMYRRQVDGRATTWCPEWWKHAEAITPLEAIWRAWEHLRLDPATGISVRFTTHADPNMTVLLDPAGPSSGAPPNAGTAQTTCRHCPTTIRPRRCSRPTDLQPGGSSSRSHQLAA